MRIPLLDAEKWWGAATDLGPQMPFEACGEVIDLRLANYNNQTAPLLLSNKGRYIWADGPLRISFDSTAVNVEAYRGQLQLSQSDDPTLRGAYNDACRHYFPPQGSLPPTEFFAAPIYNTWIELMYDQNQADILKYAHDIIDHGFPPGVLMIDDNWQEDYGVWQFRHDRFPDPAAMVEQLHSLGFKVMLWVCPFVSPDSKEARDLHARGFLVKARESDEMAVMQWWNGFSACIDLSNPDAYAYLRDRFKSLQERFGIDGFKFDAGDPERYLPENVAVFDGRSYDTEQTRLWAQLAMEFPFNELRACWQMGNQPLVQRLGDKKYSWDGVGRLVPSMIAAALIGHSFACPDMIGGGEYSSFLNIDSGSFDPALIIRSCQIHAAMPMMQFSVAPWRILGKEHLDICRTYANWHCQLGKYILEMAETTATTGTPIVRHMAYAFPDEGFEEINDQYMLGDRYLIAPVVAEGSSRTVKLPRGRWRDDNGKVFKGGRSYVLTDIALDRLPRFEKL